MRAVFCVTKDPEHFWSQMLQYRSKATKNLDHKGPKNMKNPENGIKCVKI